MMKYLFHVFIPFIIMAVLINCMIPVEEQEPAEMVMDFLGYDGFSFDKILKKSIAFAMFIMLNFIYFKDWISENKQ